MTEGSVPNGDIRPDSGDTPVATQEMVGIEIIPAGKSPEKCEGAVVRLVKGLGTDDDKDKEPEQSLACGLGPDQCREIARRLLVIADAAMGNTQRTVMCITPKAMWDAPGQSLIVSMTPAGVRFEFTVDLLNKAVQVPPTAKRRLILPPGLRPNGQR